MSFKLDKPYTDRQYADFVVMYNHERGLDIKESTTAVYALEANEQWNEQTQLPEINPNYDAEQLDKAKLLAKQTSYKALTDIEQFTFYIKDQTKGVLLKNTPTMTIDRAIGELDKVAQQIRGLQAGSFRYYDIQRGQQLPSPELKPYDVNLLYFQMFLAYREADAYYTALEKQYNSATTIDEVNQIVASIDYKKTLADKVDTIYAQAKAMLKLGTEYKYLEIGSEENNDLPEGFKVVKVYCQEGADNIVLNLPEVVRCGTVLIENGRTSEVTIKAFGNEFIAGVGAPYVVDSNTVVQLTADKENNAWDVQFIIDNNIQANTLDIEFEINPSGDRQNISSIKFGKGLTGYVDPDKNGVVVEVQEGQIVPPSLYATLAYPLELTNRENDAIHRGLLWFDDIVVATSLGYMDIRKDEKSIGIQEYDNKDPNVTGGQEYLVILRLSFKGKAPADGFIEASIIDKVTQDVLKDMDDKPFAVYRTYNELDNLSVIHVIGIVKAKALTYLQAYTTNNFPKDENIVLNDHVSGNSCLLIQALTANNRAGSALLKYELDNGERVLLTQRYLGELYDSKFLRSYDLPKTTGEAEQGETDADGSHFYNKYKMNVAVENEVIEFASEGTELCLFNWGKIFDAEITEMLQGEIIDVDAVVENPDCAFNIQLVKWIGDPDKYTDKIITDNVNDADVFEANWEVVDKQFIAENPSGRQAITATFTVPTDAKNMAVIISPAVAQNPLTLKIHDFKINVANPRYKYLCRGIETLDQKQMNWQDDALTMWNPLPANYTSYRFSGSNVQKKLPWGLPKVGNIPADYKKWDVVEGYDYGNQVDLAFYDDVNIEVDLFVNIHADKLEPVYFFLTDEDKEIPGTRVEFTPKVAHEQQAKIPTMKTKARNGETIGLAWITTSEDGAYLETDDKRYPMLIAKIRTQGAV